MLIDVIVPTLGRPHALGPLTDSLEQHTRPGAWRLIVVCDRADDASIRVADQLPATVVIEDGTYPHKTNAGARAGTAPLVLPTADDVRFHPGWLEHALAALEDPAVLVVGTCDLTPATADGTHATMPIVRRSYIEHPGAAWNDPGVVFHEGYHHNFVETELWQLAEHRGVAKMVPASVIEHLHPDWGTAELDATYEKGARTGWKRDGRLFAHRRKAWSRS